MRRRTPHIDFEHDEAVGRLSIIKLREQIHRANALADPQEIDAIATSVAEKQVALKTVTASGNHIERFSQSLRAICNPTGHMTEADIRNSGGVPLSEDDIKSARTLEKYRMSLEYNRQCLQLPTLTLQQIAGDRCRIAYRLIRQLASIRGEAHPGELLIETLSTYQHAMSKWELPTPYLPGSGVFRGYRHVIDILMSLNHPHTTYTYHGNNCKPVYTWGLSYLPVPIPDTFFLDKAPQSLADNRRNRVVPEGYDVFEDFGLMSQLFVYEQIAEYLDIGSDNPTEMAALSALLNPTIARLAWPTQDELENYEETILFPWIYQTLTTNSYEKSTRILREQLHVTYLEAMDMIETGKHFIKYVARFSKDLERSVMFSRLDSLTDSCLSANMVTTALNCIKVKLQAVGLTTPDKDLQEDRNLALSSGLKEKIKEAEEPDEPEQIEGNVL